MTLNLYLGGSLSPTLKAAAEPDGVNLPQYIYRKTLQKALMKQGMNYKAASLVNNADIGFNRVFGIPYINPDISECGLDPNLLLSPCQVRLQDADAVLYDTKSSGLQHRSGSEKVGTFKKQTNFEVAGQNLAVTGSDRPGKRAAQEVQETDEGKQRSSHPAG